MPSQILAVFLLLASAAAPCRAQINHGAVEPTNIIPSHTPVSAEEAEQWREDLDHMVHQLAARHRDLYHTVSPGPFATAVEALRKAIPLLARHQIIVRFQRIVALVGDGHTSVPFLFDPAAGFHVLPLRFGWYTDGIWVEAGDRSLAQAVGARVTAIGDVPIEEAVQRVTPLIPRDNDIWIRVLAPMLLTRTEVLHAVGLSDDPMSARLTVEGPDGTRTLLAQALHSPVTMAHGTGRRTELTDDWFDALPTDSRPNSLRRTGEHYWWTPLPEDDAVYFQYNQVINAPDGPTVHEAIGRALAHGDAAGLRTFILDIRNNMGGEGSLNRGVVQQILKSPFDEPGRFFVIIGARTFSAAQLLAHKLDHWTEATFIGEPTGSSPQFYGDHSFFRLPNSRILVSASPTWWQPGGPYDRRPFLPPDVAAEPAFEDYRTGRDPALAVILGWDDRVTLHEILLPVARGQNVDAAEERLRAWVHDPAQRYADARARVNAEGYRIARGFGWEAAIRVFRLNLRVHPAYANGWDTLGEALMATGSTEEGLDAYAKAHSLDPGVGNAAAVLLRHGRLPPSATLK